MGPLKGMERARLSGPAEWALPAVQLLLNLWVSKLFSGEDASFLLGPPEVGMVCGVRLAQFSSCLSHGGSDASSWSGLG